MKIGPKYKIARRLGADIFEKTQTQKYMLSEAKKSRTTTRGKRRKIFSDYGKQLLEKQKVRFTYGISEKQFKNVVKESVSQQNKEATEALYENLESRLDNVVYRLGLSPTRRMARQMVSHGHIIVNGRKLTIPSYKVKEKDQIAIREGSKNKGMFAGLEDKIKKDGGRVPSWIKFDLPKKEAVIQGRPALKKGETLLDLNTVIEFYSK
ncbi:MAG: 30S ribosomal protein S4 [Parcubacteria group bacterium]|jgi:small subunit ribosomal protein S4|nr:30S ribosomal protein S4 [Parcubacteria group bacterium]|tara:strand:- start:7081 stop:7704 length:624 start_codon:yes stop_codon:yes gene_type:complete